MYTEQELTDIQAQQKRRWVALLIPSVVLLGVVVTGFILRLEWLTEAASILLGVTLIAGWDLLIKPLHRYEIHLNNMLHGITHELEGDFGSFSPDISEVDGVRYYAMNLICLDEKQKPYDRLFYYDAEKPLPAFTTGEHIVVTYHDRELAAVRAA